MSAIVMFPPDDRLTTIAEGPTCARVENEEVEAAEPQSRDDDLWPWVLLPDGRLELAADVA